MAFRVEISTPARRQILRWGLSDTMLVEVNPRLGELGEATSDKLVRLRKTYDGLYYILSQIDPENRIREHVFVFHVVFSQDEERLIVLRGTYQRRDH